MAAYATTYSYVQRGYKTDFFNRRKPILFLHSLCSSFLYVFVNFSLFVVSHSLVAFTLLFPFDESPDNFCPFPPVFRPVIISRVLWVSHWANQRLINQQVLQLRKTERACRPLSRFDRTHTSTVRVFPPLKSEGSGSLYIFHQCPKRDGEWKCPRSKFYSGTATLIRRRASPNIPSLR